MLTGSSRLQACQLKCDTITYEEKEQQLVNDCVKELRECDEDAFTSERRDLSVLGNPTISFFFLLWSVCVLVPGESNCQMVSLSDELSEKNEELLRHQEEISQLLSKIVELQHRVKEVRRLVPDAWNLKLRPEFDE